MTGSAPAGDQLTESVVPGAAPLKACASSARSLPDSPMTLSSTLHTARLSLTSSLWASRLTLALSTESVSLGPFAAAVPALGSQEMDGFFEGARSGSDCADLS